MPPYRRPNISTGNRPPPARNQRPFPRPPPAGRALPCRHSMRSPAAPAARPPSGAGFRHYTTLDSGLRQDAPVHHPTRSAALAVSDTGMSLRVGGSRVSTPTYHQFLNL